MDPIRENKMGVMPVTRLLLSMSIPMMLSMIVQAAYNIVDSIFVSRINENALTAVSMAFPMQMLLIAFAVGTAIGTNALLSKSLGEKNLERVDRTAMNGILLEMIFYAVFAVIGFFLSEPFFRSQTSDPEIIEFGVQYMQIVLCCSFGIYMEIVLERLLQSTGRTVYSMIAQLCGAVFNLIFDPILIFGLLGFPALGVRGAAIATILGQHVAAAVALMLNLKRNPEIRFSLKNFKPDRYVIKRILAVGIPSTVMQSIGSFLTYFMNLILVQFTSTAVAVYGVYFKLNSIIFMPVFGLNSGMIPIIAYNYGANKGKRVKKTIFSSVVVAVIIMTVGCLIFEIFPATLLRFFNASDHMVSIGVPALRQIALSFPIAGYCIVAGSVYQALGRGVYSMIISVCRQLVVLLPAAFLLARTGVLDNVWWSYLIAEFASLTLSIIFMRRAFTTIINKLAPE